MKVNRDAQGALDLRRDLFYGVCRMIEGSYSDSVREAEFYRQRTALAKRLGYGPEPKRLTAEYRLSPQEFRRMKAAIRRNLKLSQPTWLHAKNRQPPTSAARSEVMSQS